jgi:hypothetical protein
MEFDDATFDKLFPPDQPSVPQGPSQAELAQRAEATRAINERDQLIHNMRQQYALATGVDPLTGQPVGQGNGAPRQVDYTQDREKYMNDLYAAAQRSPNDYVNVQQKFVMDTLGPLAPLVKKFQRQQTVEALSKSDTPEAAKYIGTQSYQRVLSANPELANAIAVAESDLKWHSRLPGLYKLAYQAGKGLEAAQRQVTSQNQPQTPTTPPRTQAQVNQSFKTLEGIRATIAAYEKAGVKLDF